ncbi:MAG: helix-turn-helix domain-containing protein [Fluviicoccus sp.]|uniref:AraC family transcriptional regulator n=1 Tax=Fluviicoccus sp. TaxID=2003552 RepID=UPI002728AC19|nr:AraC family transcriptional regulator [Fluviicoccus sp.]MDO8329218.1 helix-turn-helix domain-containing protein [Fluviicoccus sp.]
MLDEAEGLLNEASLLTGDPDAALRIGQQSSWSNLGALGHMLSNAQTLEDLLNSYVYYEALFYGSNIANLQRDPGSLTLYWNTRDEYRKFACFSISSVVNVVRRSGIPAECMAAVSLPFNDESAAGVYAEILHCNTIVFGQVLGVTVRREFLGREVHVCTNKSDRSALLRRLFPEINDAELTSRLYYVITAALPQREANLALVAEKLVMSPRTVQRRLSAIPDGLRGAIGRVRMHLAKEYLCDKSMPLVAVSMLLGYSEQSAFQLAFRKQFGVTPGQWRRDSQRLVH